MKIEFAFSFFVFLALSGCSNTPQDLQANSPPTIQTFKENYQEIYRRIAPMAKRCYSSNLGSYASMAVDSELYSELGYGEVTVSLIDMGVRNYYITVRVDKQPTGSKMTLHTGNTLAAERERKRILDWANNVNQDCTI